MRLREAFVWLSLVLGICSVAIIELLSLGRAITPFWLALAWGGVAGAGLIYLLIKRPAFKFAWPKGLDLIEKILLSLIGLILFFTLFTALVAPPNNYDSMTYHLSRVAHWAQDQSVANYPTFILRQLAMPPAAEFAILHYYVLLGSDRLANFVQWQSMLGCLIVVSLIAGQLGGNRKAQLLAAFFCATLPMGIMQATSTQTDYFTAYWLVSMVFLLMRGRPSGGAVSFALAALSKPTAYILALPFIIWSLIAKKNAAIKTVVLFAAALLIFNAGYFYRNYSLSGSLLGPDYGTRSQTVNPLVIAVNLFKTGANNFNSPWTAVNHASEQVVGLIARGLGVAIDDPAASSFGKFTVEKYTPHEDVIGNPLHLLWLLAVLGLILFYRRQERGRVGQYALALGAAVLLFFLLIKYQPWVNRLLLPWFVLGAPLAGWATEKYFDRRLVALLIVLAGLIALPPLLMNITRPIIPPPLAARSKFSILTTPREYFYLTSMNETRVVYEKVRELVRRRGYRSLGLVGVNNEYPLWAMLRGERVKIAHLLADGDPGQFDAVIMFIYEPALAERLKGCPMVPLGKDSFENNVRLFEIKVTK